MGKSPISQEKMKKNSFFSSSSLSLDHSAPPRGTPVPAPREPIRSRRSFLRASCFTAAALLAACGPTPAEQTANPDGEIDVIAEGLAFPEGPAFDPQNRLWWTELGNGDLVILDDGKQRRFPSGGSPNGLAFDLHGRAYVADSKQMAIRRFTFFTQQWETLLDSLDGKPLQNPNDLCFDGLGNLLFSCPNYASAEKTGYVAVLRPDGTAHRVGAGYNQPNGLDLVSGGKALVLADTLQKKLFKGVWVAESATWLDSQEFADVGGAVGPDGMYPGGDGLIYQAVYGDGVVRVIDARGTITREIRLPGKNPTNLAVDPTGKLGLVVSEAETGRILSLPSVQPGVGIQFGGEAWS